MKRLVPTSFFGILFALCIMVIPIPEVSAGVPMEGFSEVVKKVGPAVVSITVTGGKHRGAERGAPPNEPPDAMPPEEVPPMMPEPPGKRGPEQSAGSGVIVSPNGLVVTNNHVVDGSTAVTVMLPNKREYAAKVLGTDPKTDLAVLKIDAENLTALAWADPAKLQVGDLVLAIGNPFGLSSSVSMGIVSALGRSSVGIADYEDFIQTDAAINPGNSGGALVNMKGELVGINTAIFSKTGGSEGIGFAIPASIAANITSSLATTGKVVRGWLGVVIQDVTPALAKSFKLPSEMKGALVSDVNEHGPGYSAGLQRGDTVVSFNGTPIEGPATLRNLVAQTPVGKTVPVVVMRGGETITLALVTQERPPDEALLAKKDTTKAPPAKTEKPSDNVFAGIQAYSFEALSREQREQFGLMPDAEGVVVGEVLAGSAAEKAGLQRGDVIKEIDHKAVKNIEDYKKTSSLFEKNATVVVLVQRSGNSMFVALSPE